MSKVIGIDLGTTFSAIASLDDLGNPEVLASIEDNRKITASAVYLKDKEVIVGDKALNYLKDQSKNVILQTKREMENDVVYSTEEGKWVNDKNLVDAYTPAQVSALILKKLKEYTNDVKKVVITVPAMFAEKARQATLDAAKIADLEVIELINEPTAAVLHYASLPGVEVGGRVMIFDLGGGTFDVTFAEVKNKKVDVMTSRGDKYLGGGLKQSIGSEVIGSNAQIFAKKKYAPYQEFGTGRFVDTKEAQAIGIPAAEIKRLYKGKGIKKVNIQPQPFFFPAVRKGLKKLLDDIEVSLKKLV